MKKIIFVLIAAMSLTLLASCKEEPDFIETIVVGGTETAAPASDDRTDTSTEDTTSDAPAPATFEVTISEYTESDEHYKATVKYPVFSGIDNAEMLTEIVRDYLIAMMQNDLSYKYVGEEYYTYSLDSVENTLAGDSFASFLCFGSCYADGADHLESFVYTLNLDTANGRLYESSDIIADFGVFSKLFEDASCFEPIPSGNTELDKELSAMSRADLIGQYNAAYGIYPPVYFIGGDEVKLAVSAETVYALGNHAEFSADLDKADDALTDEILQLTKGNQ